MSIYAYIRVSTEMQTFENQEYEICRYCSKRGLTVDRWVTESVSGTVEFEKRQLGKVIRKMSRGDPPYLHGIVQTRKKYADDHVNS